MLKLKIGLRSGLASAILVATGCAPLPVVELDTHLHDELVSKMDSCIAGQEQLGTQLQTHQALLEGQAEQLKTLAEKRGPVAAPAPPVKRTICPPMAATGGKQWVGQLEKVWMTTLNLALSARIDTGAETSSLDARDVEIFERNGKRWVRFEIEHPEKGEAPILVERKVTRMVSIVQSNSADSERRPVIKLGITIGNVNQTAEFTLSNRSHLDFQVLVGRNILKDVMVVDVSQENIAPFVKPVIDANNQKVR
jgi:hypothetical protein